MELCALGACTPTTLFAYHSLDGFGTDRDASEITPPPWFGNGVESEYMGTTIAMDVNGDGFDDIVYPDLDGERPNGSPALSYFVALSVGRDRGFAGSRFHLPTNTQLRANGEDQGGGPPNCLWGTNVMDYNGDGRDDIVDACENTSASTFLVHLSTGTAFQTEPIDVFKDGTGMEDRLYTADLTGDGHPDLIHCAVEEYTNRYQDFRYDVYENLGPGNGFAQRRSYDGLGPSCSYAPFFIDVDGDGVVNMIQRERDPYYDLYYARRAVTDFSVPFRALVIEGGVGVWTPLNLDMPAVSTSQQGEVLNQLQDDDIYIKEFAGSGCEARWARPIRRPTTYT